MNSSPCGAPTPPAQQAALQAPPHTRCMPAPQAQLRAARSARQSLTVRGSRRASTTLASTYSRVLWPTYETRDPPATQSAAQQQASKHGPRSHGIRQRGGTITTQVTGVCCDAGPLGARRGPHQRCRHARRAPRQLQQLLRRGLLGVQLQHAIQARHKAAQEVALRRRGSARRAGRRALGRPLHETPCPGLRTGACQGLVCQGLCSKGRRVLAGSEQRWAVHEVTSPSGPEAKTATPSAPAACRAAPRQGTRSRHTSAHGDRGGLEAPCQLTSLRAHTDQHVWA
jgi:hypothetical protein